MNIKKRIEKLERPTRKLREEESQLEEEARKAGFTLDEYKEIKKQIAALSPEELLKMVETVGTSSFGATPHRSRSLLSVQPTSTGNVLCTSDSQCLDKNQTTHWHKNWGQVTLTNMHRRIP